MTKQQLLKEAKMLETKLANVKKQIAKEETLRMQMLAGVLTEGQYKKRLNEDLEWNDDIIYDNLLSKDHEQLVSDMLYAAENNLSLTLVDYLKQYDYSEEDD
jgi:hypothetical protein